MNTKFDSKSFNPEAFGKYVESVPRLKRNEILKSKAVVGSQTLAELFASQTGSHYARIPMFGQATANVVNYMVKQILKLMAQQLSNVEYLH